MAEIQEVNLGDTTVLQGLREMIEDRMRDVMKHCMDPNVIEGKPCEITVKVKLTPKKNRVEFDVQYASSTRLAPRVPAQTTFWVTRTKQGLEVVESNPQQIPLDLSQP